MEYVIDPMWFYWISVADAARTMAILVMAVAVVAVITGGAVFYTNAQYGADDDDVILGRKVMKIGICVLIPSALLVLLVPGRETLIEMLVARLATKEKAALTVDALKSAVDYIVEAMKSIK